MAVAREIGSPARRASAVLGTAAFLVLAPGTVVGYVPWLISHWQVHSPFPGFMLLRLVGIVLILAGILVLLECFTRFAAQGIGTPAPVFPTKQLIVTGAYRFVRNPMFVAVLAILLGQAMFFGNVGIIIWAACAWIVAALFVIGYEEPTMRRTYGSDYEAYRARVPRWIPRLRPWS